MRLLSENGRSRMVTAILSLIALLLVILIILYPDQAFKSSLGGLRLWWTVLLPGLLPFYILVEIVTGLGLVRAFGALFEPLLRFLFRIPRGGGEALTAGLLAGYPVGAEATMHLYAKKALRQGETNRLLSLSHLCSPVTMVTVIGVSFLHSIRAGLFIAAIHYVAAFVVALLLRNLPDGPEQSTDESTVRIGMATRFFRAMSEAREEDGRSFGKLLGEAVAHAIQTLFSLSGFIIFFSVLCRMISLQLPPAWSGSSLIPALLEPHLGSYSAAVQTGGGIWLYAFIGAVLGWSGLTQHLQVRGIMNDSRIGYLPFLLGRCLHAGFAFILTFALGAPLTHWLSSEQFSFLPIREVPQIIPTATGVQETFTPLWPVLWSSTGQAASVIVLLFGGLAMLTFLLTPLLIVENRRMGR
ncbi:MAG: sporulation protein [Gorillibacterium sp.]|nr:sporulation protein [Gorillibacterium sp.]